MDAPVPIRRQLMVGVVTAVTMAPAGCSDDGPDRSVELDDGVTLAVHDNCVEIDGPTAKGSSCGTPLVVGASVVGGDEGWVFGLTPADTERVVFGDEADDRLLEQGDLRAFALPYQVDAVLVAEDADGAVIHEFRVPLP